MHIHSMCRQVPGCWNRIGQFFRGEKGIADITGLVAADQVYIGGADGKSPLSLPKSEVHNSSYVQEHVDVLESILDVQADQRSPEHRRIHLERHHGRISAYAGEMVTWDEMMESDFRVQTFGR